MEQGASANGRTSSGATPSPPPMAPASSEVEHAKRRVGRVSTGPVVASMSNAKKSRSGSLDTAMQGYVFVSQGGKSFFSQRATREYAILHKHSSNLPGLEGALEFFPPDGALDKPTKVLSVSSLLKVEVPKSGQKKRHMFVLSAVGQRLEIACKSKQERDMWVQGTGRLISTSKKEMLSPSDASPNDSIKSAAEDLFLCTALSTLLSRRLQIAGKECIVDLSGNEVVLISSSGELERWEVDELVHIEVQDLKGFGNVVTFVLKSHDESRLFPVELLQLAHKCADQILAVTTLRLQTAACINNAVRMREQEVRASVKKPSGKVQNDAAVTLATKRAEPPTRKRRASSDAAIVLSPTLEINSGSATFSGTEPQSPPTAFSTVSSPSSSLSSVSDTQSLASIPSLDTTPHKPPHSFKVRITHIEVPPQEEQQSPASGPKVGEMCTLLVGKKSVDLLRPSAELAFSWPTEATRAVLENAESIAIHEVLATQTTGIVYTLSSKQAAWMKKFIDDEQKKRSLPSQTAASMSSIDESLRLSVDVLDGTYSAAEGLPGKCLIAFGGADMQLLDADSEKVVHTIPFAEIMKCHCEGQCVLEIQLWGEGARTVSVSCDDAAWLLATLNQCIAAVSMARTEEQAVPATKDSVSAEKRHQDLSQSTSNGSRASLLENIYDVVKPVVPVRPRVSLPATLLGSSIAEVFPTAVGQQKGHRFARVQSTDSIGESTLPSEPLSPRSSTTEDMNVYDTVEGVAARSEMARRSWKSRGDRDSAPGSSPDIVPDALSLTGEDQLPSPQQRHSLMEESANDFVPTLVQRLAMNQPDQSDELDGELHLLPEESEDGDDDGGGGGDDDNSSNPLTSSGSGTPALVSPYAVFATDLGRITPSRDSTGSEYAQVCSSWSTSVKVNRHSKVYINPNSPSPESLDGWKNLEARLIGENKDVDHTYMAVTDGRQPEPLPRSELNPTVDKPAPGKTEEPISQQQKTKAVETKAVEIRPPMGMAGSSLAAFALQAVMIPTGHSNSVKDLAQPAVTTLPAPSLTVPPVVRGARAKSMTDMDSLDVTGLTSPPASSESPQKPPPSKEKPAKASKPSKAGKVAKPPVPRRPKQGIADLASQIAVKARTRHESQESIDK